MKDSIAEPPANYGGSWTIKKLDILEKYLNAYTTALKGQPFKLAYIDAFAGTGYLELDEKASGRQQLHPRLSKKSFRH